MRVIKASTFALTFCYSADFHKSKTNYLHCTENGGKITLQQVGELSSVFLSISVCCTFIHWEQMAIFIDDFNERWNRGGRCHSSAAKRHIWKVISRAPTHYKTLKVVKLLYGSHHITVCLSYNILKLLWFAHYTSDQQQGVTHYKTFH